MKIDKNNKNIEINNELLINSEKNENIDFKDFDVSKMEKILTFKTEIYSVFKIFVLKDGRILLSGQKEDSDKYLYNVFDLKNNNILNLNLKNINSDIDIIQMDDGVVSILNKSNDIMILIDIKEKDFEIIQILNKINGYKLFKLLNQKIIMVNSQIL